MSFQDRELKRLYEILCCTMIRSYVYPTAAIPVTLATDSDAWAFRTAVEIVPASTITSDFMIDMVNVEYTAAADTFELVLTDGSDNELGRARFVTTAKTDPNHTPISTGKIAANTQIKAKVMYADASSHEVKTSIMYHKM